MKAITIKQPWASLIAWGVKDVENRTWKTNHRGKIYIHAGARWYPGAQKCAINVLDDAQLWHFTALMADQNMVLNFEQNKLPLSAIIGEVEIVDCIDNSNSVWAIPGQWHWVLKNAVMYPHPIACPGAMSFWKPSDKVVAYLEKANNLPQ